MKRTHGHAAFALVAVSLCAITVVEGIRLHHAQQVNAAVSTWSTAPSARPPHRDSSGPLPASASVIVPAGDGNDSPKPPRVDAPGSAAPPPPNTPPEARLARAVALARTDYDAALATYKSIIQSDREDLRRIALFDLGNLHLRQALRTGLADDAQSLPLTELAKQSYRDLLRRDPTNWDARYNLERTLRLAPEDDDEADTDTAPPEPREHERSTISDPRMDLP